MNEKNEDDYARVVNQPLAEHGDLPRPATSTSVEDAIAMLAMAVFFGLLIHGCMGNL